MNCAGMDSVAGREVLIAMGNFQIGQIEVFTHQPRLCQGRCGMVVVRLERVSAAAVAVAVKCQSIVSYAYK